MNTNLRLLLDEDVQDPIADEICNISAFNVECVRDLPAIQGKSDREVMAYANSKNRIVLTIDGGYTKARYPICTHPGIIRIDSKCKHSAVVCDVIRRFSLSGYRIKAQHAITHLTRDEALIEGPDCRVLKCSI